MVALVAAKSRHSVAAEYQQAVETVGESVLALMLKTDTVAACQLLYILSSVRGVKLISGEPTSRFRQSFEVPKRSSSSFISRLK